MLVVPGAGASDRRPAVPVISPRLLLIDHQQLFLHGLSRLLLRPPLLATLATATSTDLGLDTLARGEFDAVVSECPSHPLPAGRLLADVRERQPALPVVFIGDETSTAELLRVFRAGAAGIFEKATPTEEFIAGLAAVLLGHRAVSSGLCRALLSPRGRSRTAGAAPALA